MSETPIQPVDPSASAAVSISCDPVSLLLRASVLSPPVRPGIEGTLDRFEIIQVLGEGGMGIVLLAHDPENGRRVAIKLLKLELATDPQVVTRFCAEATHMQNLLHPNILKILERSDRSKRPYFVLPYMRRGSLSKLICDTGPVECKAAVQIASQVADALACAHKHGILHRDVKPANILLGDDGEAYLTDFGLGKATLIDPTANHAQGRSIEGTAAYMAPEITAADVVECERDIYAFGATLYEMLAGRPPYSGATTSQVFQQVQSGPPTPIREVNPQSTVRLIRIAEGAMAREPRDRYAHMADVVADLARVSTGQCPLGPRAQPRIGIARRQTRLAFGVALACVALVVIAVAVWSPWNRNWTAPYRYDRVGTSTVAAFTEDNRPLWTVQVDGTISKFEPIELERGKPKGLVVGVASGKDMGKIFVYNARRELVWKNSTAERYPYNDGTSNQMAVVDLLVADLWQTGEPSIVVVSNDFAWYPSKISIFDKSGNLKRIYWHPGHIQGVTSFMPSSGGRRRILARACNNKLLKESFGPKKLSWCYALVCLDPETMSGEAPPRLGTIGAGKEAWYVQLMPPDAVINRVRLQPPTPDAVEGSPSQLIELACGEDIREFVYLNENGERVGGASGTGPTKLRTELIAQDPSARIPGASVPQTQPSTTSRPA